MHFFLKRNTTGNLNTLAARSAGRGRSKVPPPPALPQALTTEPCAAQRRGVATLTSEATRRRSVLLCSEQTYQLLSVFRAGFATAPLVAAAPEQTMSSPPKVKAETRAGHPPAGTAATPAVLSPRCPSATSALLCLLWEVYSGRASWGRREADNGERSHLSASAGAFKLSLGLGSSIVWIRPLLPR